MIAKSGFRAFALILICILLTGAGPVVLNVLVDPFERNGLVDLGIDKRRVALARHGQLYKVNQYSHRIASTLILGDSRARALREKYFTSVRYPGVFNFAFGGGTLPEAFSAYWFAARRGDLKAVVIGVPLRMFSERYKRGKNQMTEAVAWHRDSWTYYASLDVLETSLDLLERSDLPGLASALPWLRDLGFHALVSSALADEAKPTKAEARAQKWRMQIDVAARSDWRSFHFSERYFAELRRVVDHARRNGTRVVLFIPPTPIEMQRRIEDFGRTGINFSFRKRLAQLAPVVDFDFYSPRTADTENFKDAYHFDAGFARQISAELVRFLPSSDKSRRTVEKRRDGVFCPTKGTDKGARVIDLSVRLLVGESCRVWIARKEIGR